jgi:hypothetical protein
MKTHLIYLREATQHVKKQGKRLVLIERLEPVACVAIQEDGINSAYQLSECSHLDTFDKPLARRMAEGRLAKKPIAHPLPVDGGFWNTTRSVVLTIAHDLKYSRRTRRAAVAYMEDQQAKMTKLQTDGDPSIH